MYSLYRAWFSGEESYPRMETLSPPDTLIRVGNEGEHQFVAHRGILAAHSGYLKALLATATSTGTSSTSAGSEAPVGVTSVSVSSIGGEAFAPLLSYMYTGRLEVTLDNIYSVLLATHLLHMPGALEQCRAALLRLRAPPLPAPTPRASSVLRPVPNRIIGPPLCWPQPALYPSAPVGLSHLPSLPLPPTIPTIPIQMIHDTRPYRIRETSRSPISPTDNERARRSRSRSGSPEGLPASPRKQDRSGETEEVKDHSSRGQATGRSPSPSGSSERISVTDIEPSRRRGQSRSSVDTGTGTSSVVYDVACCDGPVRFHRVLNENYSAPAGGVIVQRQRACLEDDVVVGENDENGHPDASPTDDNHGEPGVSGNANGSYTCTYCKHTFKSHYCYQKHARRHLLPIEASETTGSSRQGGKKREVRLLNLNVQYYPCKICGSKFPSYYFVHKHRKLCHSNVEDAQSGSEETANAVQNSNSNNA
ncbi:uncharacterized protein LOC112494215 isoform X2 [Cephus cinctus]|uniref:Uncharacterized protein LOC112494215 isoform X2 n=1 Tax=Cephus cinctus TaxID=211228 RepID=A0AAJ7RFC7_CEPCN|nr:uncharacterized protein LOC112494215 isoform X2 [Cephus cinctus]